MVFFPGTLGHDRRFLFSGRAPTGFDYRKGSLDFLVTFPTQVFQIFKDRNPIYPRRFRRRAPYPFFLKPFATGYQITI
jgi:hypothetical protein